jgi:hypothetical protein
MFNANDLGKSFIKLTLAKDTDLADDIKAYDGDDTYLLNCYTLEADAYDETLDFASIVDSVDRVQVVEAVIVMGSMHGDTRCYTNSVSVLVLKDGTMYMDEALHDEVFC